MPDALSFNEINARGRCIMQNNKVWRVFTIPTLQQVYNQIERSDQKSFMKVIEMHKCYQNRIVN